MSDIAKTPREELKCRKKYLYEHSMFFECNDGSKCQILEEDVCDLLNELVIKCNHLEKENEQLKQSNDRFVDTVAKQVSLFIELRKENEQLRTQLLICKQSKNDDGRFKVWQVPPIQKGMRITTFTTSDGDKDEI